MNQRYTEVARSRLLDEWQRTGEPLCAVAKRQGIKKATAYCWARRLGGVRRKQVALAPAGFAQVVRAVPVCSTSLVVKVGRAAIRVDRGFDAELLRRVVGALGESSDR